MLPSMLFPSMSFPSMSFFPSMSPGVAGADRTVEVFTRQNLYAKAVRSLLRERFIPNNSNTYT